MAPLSQPSAWDLSPVFDLLQTLSHDNAVPKNPAADPNHSALCMTNANHKSAQDSLEQSLGDFNKIWNFLGVQHDVPLPSVPSFAVSAVTSTPALDAYASDGALYYPPSSKSVKWRDEEDGLNLTDVQPDSPVGSTSLTKNQRKKRNRKARKNVEVETVVATPASPVMAHKNHDMMTTTTSLSGGSYTNAPHDTKATMKICDMTDATASEQVPTQNSHLNVPRVSNFTSLTAKVSSDLPLNPMVSGTTPKPTVRSNEPNPASIATLASRGSVSAIPTTPTQSRLHERKTSASPQTNTLKKDSLTRPIVAAIPLMAPQTPQTQPKPRTNPSMSPAVSLTVPKSASNSGRKRYEILPVQFVDSVDRHWSLLLKLMKDFPEDRKHLLSPLQLSINRAINDGIHVFVDASNIIIGFHETLKRARGIPYYAHVPHVNLNFHALALLLERRRPVTKRVLAGSTPEIPAFEEARQVGYETCILDKVWKAKELTERQRRFATRDHSDGNGYQSASDSAGNLWLPNNLAGANHIPAGSSSPGTIPQQPKWVEQAVDEILHLKILESIVDTSSAFPSPTVHPSANGLNTKSLDVQASPVGPTMILATGDAAEAEYSSGFMKMVQRALSKGWNVEIVAWGKSISMEYRRMAKSATLSSRFRLIELDDYAEELFGEAV